MRTMKVLRTMAVSIVSVAFALSLFGCVDSSSEADEEPEQSTSSSTSTSSSASTSSSSYSSSGSSSKSSTTNSSSSSYDDTAYGYSHTLDNGDEAYSGSDGYTYYKNSDGSLEVTDGYGNAMRLNNDGSYEATTDGGRTWSEVD